MGHRIHPNAVSLRGVAYRSASNHRIVDEGSRHLFGSVGAKEPKAVEAHVCEVTRPLMAACDVVDAGYDVLLTRDECCAVHRASKDKIPIVRRGKEFQIEMKVLPVSPAQEKLVEHKLCALEDSAMVSSFSRQL